MNIQKTSPNIYRLQDKETNNSRNIHPLSTNISFEGGHMMARYEKMMDKPATKIAEWIGKQIQKEIPRKVVQWTNGKEKIQSNLFSHLIVLGSTLLSGFYVAKTLNNEQMDKHKRRTLAVNQTATFIVSTIMAYTFDNKMTNKTQKFIAKYKELNKDALNLDMKLKGIDTAKKIIIFDLIYRFIAPVLVTPLANHIGNKIQEKS